jgi:hypothetical protein
MKKVHVVLLNWKDIHDTVLCIESLKKIENVLIQIIVVDNASNDGSDIELKHRYPDIHLIVNEKNLGFSAGCNVGLRFAMDDKAEYILLLNNDIEISNNFFDGVFELFETDKNLGAITGKIMYKDRKNIFWQAGGKIDPLRVQGIAYGKGEEDFGQYDLPKLTGWASGAMSLFPRKTFESIGLLPEEYFFGQEEWHYSSLILKKGMNILYLPTMLGFHKSGGSYKAGHPILNVYGGYINKVIYARTFMNNYIFHFWYMFFAIYLILLWPSIIFKRYNSNSDRWLVYRAGLLALWHARNIKSVNLDVLINAGIKLGTSKNYKLDWAS